MADDPIPQNTPDGRAYCLYWIKDETCADIREHGYVGVTGRLRARERDHRKTGRFPSGFVLEVIFEGLQPECLVLERALRPHPGIGWNLAVGGPGGYRYGHSEETRKKIGFAARNISEVTREKIGAAHRGVKRSPEHCAKISMALTGKRASAETKEKLRAAHLGRKLPPEQREKIGAARRGRRHSPEAIAKMSERSRNMSAETRQRISDAQRGVKKSPEFIAKVSAARRGKPWSEAAREAHRGKHKWTEERHARMAAHLTKMQVGRIGTKHGPEAIAKIKAANARRNAARAALRKDELHDHAHKENLGGRSAGEAQGSFAFD